MTPLSAFGLFAVMAMLATYALEGRSHWFTLAFAGSCLIGSAYGFLQGAWPFGLVEGIWALVALNKWFRRTAQRRKAQVLQLGKRAGVLFCSWRTKMGNAAPVPVFDGDAIYCLAQA